MNDNTKPLKVNKATHELITNGAMAFIEKIEHPCKYYRDRSEQAIRIEPENDWYKKSNHCIREEGGGWQDFTKEEFLEYIGLPYQMDDIVYLQEEYVEIKGNVLIDCDFDEEGLVYFDSGESFSRDDFIWNTKESMTFKPSRFKYKIKDIKIMQADCLSTEDIMKVWGIGLFKIFFKQFDIERNEYIAYIELERI